MNDQRTVISRDGTAIAFDESGKGPPVILVASALANRSDTKRLGRLLATHFTVINYDRRGRGASGDTGPYAVEREVDDITALIDEAGGSAFLFGSSSGAVLALEAVAHGLNIEKLALYEPPFVVDANDPRPPADLADRLTEMLAADRSAEAVRYFMTKAIGMPAVFVNMMRLVPKMWSQLKGMAHTIPYDVAIMGDTTAGKPLDPTRWASVKAATLVMAGSKSPAWLHHAARALADVLPKAQHRSLKGLSHSAVVMAPKKLAPVLSDFFAA